MENPPFKFVVVFANTGKENEETLNFIRKCDRYLNFNTVWIEAVTNPKHGRGVSYKIVDYKTASRNGEPFRASIAKHGLSNVNAPMCTRELKTYAINAYSRKMKFIKPHRAIGIRADEIDRIKAGHKKLRYIYPLVNMWYTRKIDVLVWWAAQGFDLYLDEEDGNCDCCFKKSLAKLLLIARKTPHRFEWWEDAGDEFKDYVPASRPNQRAGPVKIYRENLTARDILELSKLSDEEVKNKLKVKDLGVAEGQCSESCEAY